MQAPIWVGIKTAIAIHHRQIIEHGGPSDTLRDYDLLDSALNKPKNLFAYTEPKPSLATLAASYAYGIIHNHPFMDGNKRTALVVCQVFLLLNGHMLTASPVEKYTTFYNLAAGKLTETDCALWIAKYLQPNQRNKA